ncbi:thiolase family protein [Priestia aryabhattai]|uniref:thiolase family protein n=1 Tax=Priestia TaxID=2800373 RepID=UPI0003A71E16|nr:MULTISPECIES: thiolase family protein [Priestia]NHH94696.1 Acetyl-CoA acetyltransferase [Bacillus sp. MB95]MBY0077707.1 thiolase family protein [Priestia aryabhattai]MED4013868.1 thiolase family protein [Priestia aryabhattai]PEI58555.1 acetyl-CoA C-acyltransferase [Priestia aryabhattai]TJZ40950.1 thiolase family protein [Priestia megaterium]
MQEEIVIVSATRTPIGRYGGALKEVSSGHLASLVIEESVKRANIAAEQVSEVIFGEVRQSTEASNVARVAALRAGIPDTAPAFTINRLCASGMQAIASAVQQLHSNQATVVVAGGTESMSRAPLYLRNTRFGGDRSTLVDSNTENGQQPQEIYGQHLGMGVTAENVAERYHISKEDQDGFAVESQQKAAKAIKNGAFKDEIIPVKIQQRKATVTVDRDEHPRPQTTIEQLSNLKPAFKENGTVTAGNTCGRNDGASALVLMKRREAERLELKPLVRIVDWAAAGVSPEVMGIGPVPAVKKLLQRTGKKVEDIGLFELNEAFASQALAVIRELNLDVNKVNVNGGAIALGHPVGATGARIVTTLLHEMIRRQERYGIATLCVGGGQGMAIMIETIL